MEKVIMIPEGRYNKMLESYDKAMAELQALREQIQEAQTGGKAVELLQNGDSTEELATLGDIFEHYADDICLRSREHPDPLEPVLEWINDQTTAVPEELRDCLVDAMAHYEKQWFINGFRYAAGIWKAC